MKQDTPNYPVTESELLQIELAESLYRVDWELFEDGQSLAKELLKLSLAGIAVVGFLLPLLPKLSPSAGFKDGIFKSLLSSSVIIFAASTAAALFQRFYASSAMFHHVRAMKLASRKESFLSHAIEKQIVIRSKKFACAHILLKATASFLFAGASLLGAAFIRLMFLL